MQRLNAFDFLTPVPASTTITLPPSGGEGVRDVVGNDSTRVEIDRLTREMEKVVARQIATEKELAIQFKRIADLQADIDLIRGAWSKMRTRAPRTKRRAD